MNKVIKTIEKIYNNLLIQKNKNLYVYKPVPSPIDKIQNTYRWRIVIKCKLNQNAITTINNVLNEFYNEKNKDISLIVDCNPNNMI